MRRDIRARRRLGPGGLRFVYGNLAELWATEPDRQHVVLTHHGHPNAWQHWAHHPEKGWVPQRVHASKSSAQEAAEFHEWGAEFEPAPDPGTYVLAGWPDEHGEVTYSMRVPCTCKNSAIAVADALHSIGMKTKREEIVDA